MFLHQGDTPKNRAEKAHDAELAAYLENRQHYQMIQREDQETAVWHGRTLRGQDEGEEMAVLFLSYMRLTPAHLGLCDGRTGTRTQVDHWHLSFLESTKTKNEAVPNLINKHLILIMTVIVMIAMTEVYVDQEAD